MTTDTQLTPAAVLDEAEAILDAERIRLDQDWQQWERELAGFLPELPALGSCAGRSWTTAARRRPTSQTPERRSVMTPSPRSPAPKVWATQRSPPAPTPKPTIQRRSPATEVMP